MHNRQAFLVVMLVLLVAGIVAVSQGIAATPADPIPAHVLAEANPVESQLAAALLVMFIPWMESPPTPSMPTDPATGDGNNTGNGTSGNGNSGNGTSGSGNSGNGTSGSGTSGGTGNKSGGTGQNTGGSGGNSGGGGTNSGGASGSGGNGHGSSGSGNPTGSGDTSGSGEPGGSIHLGGGHVQSNPEPATVFSALIGAGLLGLASLRRRRWPRA
jgi:hypothetical protein